RVDVDGRREPHDRAEPGAGAAARREAVAQAFREVSHARTAIEGDHLDLRARTARSAPEQDFPTPAVLEDVRSRLGHDEREAAPVGLVEAERRGEGRRGAPGRADVTRFPYRIARLCSHLTSNAP